jgi:hypothetical protein
MDPIVWVIVVLAGVLLAVTAYMEWIGLLSVITPRSLARCQECGHIRATPSPNHVSVCWACRHPSMDHWRHHPLSRGHTG